MKKFYMLGAFMVVSLIACSDEGSSSGPASSPLGKDFNFFYSKVPIVVNEAEQTVIEYDGQCSYSYERDEFYWKGDTGVYAYEFRGDTLKYDAQIYLGNSNSLYSTWNDIACLYRNDASEIECTDLGPLSFKHQFTQTHRISTFHYADYYDPFLFGEVCHGIARYIEDNDIILRECYDIYDDVSIRYENDAYVSYLENGEKINLMQTQTLTDGDKTIEISYDGFAAGTYKIGDVAISLRYTRIEAPDLDQEIEVTYSKGSLKKTCVRRSQGNGDIPREECNENLHNIIDQLDLDDGPIYYMGNFYSEFMPCIEEAKQAVGFNSSNTLDKKTSKKMRANIFGRIKK